MPELPEVETIVGELRSARVIGQKVTEVIIRWPPLIEGRSERAFKNMIRGARIRGICRRGKFIVVALSNGLFLLVHLRMSGQFSLAKAGRAIDPHEHIILRLGDGRELRYHDTRKFGRWRLTREPSEKLGCLGPEPLEKSFTPRVLKALLKSRRRRLKPFLLDQTMIAGLGNIYTDEALWEARLHPRRLSSSLKKRESLGLFKAIRKVLRRGIRNKGTSLGQGDGNYYRPGKKTGLNQERLNAYQRAGLPCPRCKMPIKRMIVGQRSTFICPECQKQ